MAEPFIAEIRIFAGTFAPRGWAFCDGQLLPIAQNTALFSLIGTTYGGDGRTTTGLPNLTGRAPMHAGTGPGLTQRRLGQTDGSETETLSSNQVAPHNHAVHASESPASAYSADGTMALARSVAGNAYASAAANSDLAVGALLEQAGGSQPHNNMQPYLTLNYIIALVGQFPSRS